MNNVEHTTCSFRGSGGVGRVSVVSGVFQWFQTILDCQTNMVETTEKRLKHVRVSVILRPAYRTW